MDFSPDAFARTRRLIRQNCISCPKSPPPCTSCAPDETCTAITRTCSRCASTTCLAIAAVNGSTQPANSSSSGDSTSVIAGGVVGGVAFLALVVFLIWWFVVRKHRKANEAAAHSLHEKGDCGQSRQSRRSMGSIASTVLTRTSNVIQIAYIPGVTNRSPPTTPGLIPPVPPLPGTHPTSVYSEEQRFFLPSDLRDSAYSDLSLSRHSISPSLARSSVATTIYGSNAVMTPVPAQQAIGGRAAVVSVHLASNNPPDRTSPSRAGTPAVPAFPAHTLDRLGTSGPLSTANSPIVARSMMARPVNVMKSPLSKNYNRSDDGTASCGNFSSRDPSRPATATLADSLTPVIGGETPRSKFDTSSSDEDEERPRRPRRHRSRESAVDQTHPGHQSTVATVIEDSPTGSQGPFADIHAAQADIGYPAATAIDAAVSSSRASVDSRSSTGHRHRSSHGSSQLLDETRSHSPAMAPSASSHLKSDSISRSESPFSDAHAVKVK